MVRLSTILKSRTASASPAMDGDPDGVCHAANPATCKVHGIRNDIYDNVDKNETGRTFTAHERLNRVYARRDPLCLERSDTYAQALAEGNAEEARNIMLSWADFNFRDSAIRKPSDSGDGTTVLRGVFHGSPNDFNVFNADKPCFFAKEKEYSDTVQGDSANVITHEYFLNVRADEIFDFGNDQSLLCKQDPETKRYSLTPSGDALADRLEKEFGVPKRDAASRILSSCAYNWYDLLEHKWFTDILKANGKKCVHGFEDIPAIEGQWGHMDGEQWAVFDNKLIKRADTETKDDNGKTIPLSQRFNFNTEDTRK